VRRASILILAGTLAAGGCGGGSKSDSDQAKEAATKYMQLYANKKLGECRKLVTQPQLCGDLAPLAERVNSQAKRVAVTGRSATVTVTGAATVLLDISLVKVGDRWKVSAWKKAAGT
jgi:hypothetical protein